MSDKREIKFRVYDKKKKEMCKIIEAYFIANSEIALVDLIGNGWHKEDISVDDCVLMQFTGLLDKNGKEVFEGDIVETFPDTGGSEAGVTPKMIVKWKKEYAGFYFDKPDGKVTAFIFGEPYLKIMKVIGNIYENPEIIERIE